MGAPGTPQVREFLRQGGDSFLTTRVDTVVNWSRKYSMFLYPFVTACCGMEFMSVAGPRYDLDRFGCALPRFSPRQSDLLMVVGTITHRQAPILKKVYDQMAEPKWVVAFGACTCSGGPYDNYATLQGIDTILPVDVYIPGCPPRPEGLIYGLMMIQEKIRQETLTRHFEHRAEDPTRVAKPQVGDLEVAELSGPFGNSTQQDQLSSGEVVREGSTSDDLLP